MFHSIRHPATILLNTIILPTMYGTHYVRVLESPHKYRKAGEGLLITRQELFNNEELPVETRLITDEAPEEYIENSAKEEGFDLVVIGTKGTHSKLNRILLGSVAQRVIKHAPCDVLIIK